MCTNVSFQTIPRSLLHFEDAASVPEKPADSPQVGCSVIASEGVREEGARGEVGVMGETALKAQLGDLLRVK